MEQSKRVPSIDEMEAVKGVRLIGQAHIEIMTGSNPEYASLFIMERGEKCRIYEERSTFAGKVSMKFHPLMWLECDIENDPAKDFAARLLDEGFYAGTDAEPVLRKLAEVVA